MLIPITEELRAILERVLNEGKTEPEWAEIESDDIFRSEQFDGGFDATERAFCFSYYDPNGDEFWFQITLAEIRELLAGAKNILEGRPAQ